MDSNDNLHCARRSHEELAARADAESNTPDSEDVVCVIRKNGDTYTFDRDGVSLIHFADCSPVLKEIPEDQGHTVLPFSRTALMLWQKAVPFAAARAVPSIRQPIWGYSRLQDLCTVVQVQLPAQSAHTCVEVGAEIAKMHDIKFVQYRQSDFIVIWLGHVDCIR